MTDYDPRIVALYDEANPDGPDHEYYRLLASRRSVKRVLDLGCGTGLLTVTLVQLGREVVGVDPSPAMLSFAQRRQGASQVEWILGDSADVPERGFDLIVMTGNVAQHIADPEWEQTLRRLRRLISDGGVLAFESRNPAVRAWEAWAAEPPAARETDFGPTVAWSTVDVLNGGRVVLTNFTRFEAFDDTVEERLLLTFRSRDEIANQLVAAGFNIRAVWGDWNRTPFNGNQALMVFEAAAGGN